MAMLLSKSGGYRVGIICESKWAKTAIIAERQAYLGTSNIFHFGVPNGNCCPVTGTKDTLCNNQAGTFGEDSIYRTSETLLPGLTSTPSQSFTNTVSMVAVLESVAMRILKFLEVSASYAASNFVSVTLILVPLNLLPLPST